ncbi:phosphate ABC transporter ATP-binding protein [Secundilactobacillus kimchicus]|uniref:Phosphate ABC transporter, ATP-binding protein n=1 Tax=Secundilactobacillus kimchicus JCM 15530 TaxID=1302272 RepID=A0A0R1HM72_9LACO|nr:phosphate ABC transporter ATP-binding protein PstB [Secundilactobacillus kimchicus]KRK47606.1 phosphate ABC transporter, ATP-binding protein [Secundilactobacillus kimchicus JCM 15530]MBT9672211.1 phosphate ABC transporter ATP-binding protein [Secundilactobacillus kimchicus]
MLTTENLHLYYGQKEALKGIDLAFEAQTMTALVGPSGCGKSTLLRCFNRMNDQVSNAKITGSIWFDRENVNGPAISLVTLRQKIGMVFQQPNPFPFSVYDNVAYGLRLAHSLPKAVIDERVETALKQAAVWDEVKDHLTENAMGFSGGQQQRICIARLLAVLPKVILLDEPTSALDPISSAKIEATLMQLKRDYTIIIVTHNLQQAARISDRTVFMLDGNVIESGPTQTLFMTPENQQTSDYLNGKFG